MSLFNTHHVPGMHTETDAFTNEIQFAEHHNELSLATRQMVMDKSARDTGNDPQHVIRAGMVVLQDPVSKKLYPALGASMNRPAVGILNVNVNMFEAQLEVDRYITPVVKGQVKYDRLFGINPLRARQLCERGFVFDTPWANFDGGVYTKVIQFTTDSVVVAASSHGALIIPTGTHGGGITVTLPDPTADLVGLFFAVTKATASTINVTAVENNSFLLGTGAAGNTDSNIQGTVRYELVLHGATPRYVRQA